MKIGYRTRLDDNRGGYIEFLFEIPDDNADPEDVLFGLSMVRRFIEFDQERAERQLAARRPTPPAADGSSEADR